MSTLKDMFFEHGKLDDCPVYDMHGHMGPFYGSHLPWGDPNRAVEAMDRANVRMLVFCHHAALFSPEIGNAANVEAVRSHPDRFRAYLGINPNYPDIVERDLATFDDYADVYVGFKLLADYHQVAITDPRSAKAWQIANERGLLVLLHTGFGSTYNGQDLVRTVAERYPNAKILMGHSIHSGWDAAVKLANDFPNVYFELCAVPDERGIVEKFVAESGSEKILYGTDFPWFDFHYYIGAILGADITDADRRNIFYRNAMRLLGLPAIG